MPRFQTVATIGEIPEGEGRPFAIDGRVVAVFNKHGEYYALDDMCPHAGAALSGGSIAEETVVCPWHGWRFHLCDGSWADYRKIRIGVYPVRIVGDEIQVEVPDRSDDTSPE